MSEKSFSVLFVCSGNSCRSAIAEGLMRIKIPEELQSQVQIGSAGTLGINGSTATQYAIEVTREFGGEIMDHISRGVSEELVRQADIILAMATEHKEHLDTHYPEVRDNVFLLRSFDGAPEQEDYEKDIDDPIGGNIEIYRACAEIINSELDRILPRLKKLIDSKLELEN